MKTLDMFGNPCPLPVIRAKKELENADTAGVVVLVDNKAAVQNLQKMALGMGFEFVCEEKDEGRYAVSITKGGRQVKAALCEMSGGEAVALVTCDQMGRGSEELGKMLMKGFIFSLSELSNPPAAVIFMNAGVRLATEGSESLLDLKRLESKGTEILACGTCLDYYGLTEKLTVGSVTNMFSITERLMSAEKLITL